MQFQDMEQQSKTEIQTRIREVITLTQMEGNLINELSKMQASPSIRNKSNFGHDIQLKDSQKENHPNSESLKEGTEVIAEIIDYNNQIQISNLKNQTDSNQHVTITYRRDIDGIRAIAIILVLIYHAFPQKIPGGFIGVDVFFVISSFLITQIVVKQTLKKKFSLLNFYCRRIKRIYPALIIVLCFSLWFIEKFTQKNLIDFSLQTLNSALVSCANISILLHEQNYFDANVKKNPLLHLWSLGVEEQFYIIWPFLIIFIFKFYQKRAMKIFTIFTICSFLFSIICVYFSSKLAFYFPICRFWQMSIGGILGYTQFRFRSNLLNNGLSAIGLALILITPFLINGESLFPGFWALLPTLGCCFLIKAKNDSFVNQKILSKKPLTLIGKISYSLYLWHWPLMVYSRIMYPYGSKSLFSNMYFIIGLAFGLSILTYLIVENPVRKIKSNGIVILLLILIGLVGVGSIYVNHKASFTQTLHHLQLIDLFNKVNREIAPNQQDYVIGVIFK